MPLIEFPISIDNPPEHLSPLPAEADCVVIGGGVVGVMTGYFLARLGHRPVVLEKGRIAGEQSSRNWGWIRQQGRDPDELPIMIEANAIWRQIQSELGEDIGLRQTGITYLAETARHHEAHEAWIAHAKAHGLDTVLLNGAALEAHMNGAVRQWRGGMYTASDMRAEPWLAVPALARAAVRAGARIIENCAVRRLDISAGRVSGVVTEMGRIAAPKVVLAGGAWSSLFLAAHGVRIPQLSVRASVAATNRLPEVMAGGVTDSHVAYRRRMDGCYTIAAPEFHEFMIGPDAFRNLWAFRDQIARNPFGSRYIPFAPRDYPDAWNTRRSWEGDEISPFERMRVLNPKPAVSVLRRAAARFAADHPSLGPVRLQRAWAGMIDTMPDVVPVIDRVAQIPGLIVATGMSGHGFGIGPAIGRIVSALVTGTSPGHDLSRFRISRFTDGTDLRIGPSL